MSEAEVKEVQNITAAVDEISIAPTQERSALKHEIEEGEQAYGPGGFHPVYFGDVLNEHYEILQKIGYGQYSTVWLVKDQREKEGSEDRYKALKILRADSYDPEHPIFEREILKHLRDADTAHPGHRYICHLLDDFEHIGPNGTHVCLVFDLIGETLHTFSTWFEGGLVPNFIMRKFVAQLLAALDYAHDSGVIHTDIKPDNIFIKFRTKRLIQDFLSNNPPSPQDKSLDYIPLRSQSLDQYYFDQTDSPFYFDVCLGDWGVSSWTTNHLCEIIQPVALRSPEVLIGAPWDMTTDWWNLGAVILEVFRLVQMFTGKDDRYSPYTLKNHLLEIDYFFGPFPQPLLERGDKALVQELFNKDGTMKDSELMLGHPKLLSDNYMEDLPQDTREDFVDFLKALMKIDPKDRLSTDDLLLHPWIRGGE